MIFDTHARPVTYRDYPYTPVHRVSGVFDGTVYALKIVRRSGAAPVANFSYGNRLVNSQRYYPALDIAGRATGDIRLCRTGWHVWPVRARSHISAWSWYRSAGATGWRELRGESTRDRAVWLVAVRGRYQTDHLKLAAERIRFIRELSGDEQHRLRFDVTEERALEVLGLKPRDTIWLGHLP